tara:strand:- start:410 stop:2491 length:2082 start_codon:yes stop_codon:yes gene_type:complete
MNSFDKLLTNISWLYDKGYPDFSIKEDREALYDYLLSIGFPHSDVIELSERFIGEKEEKEYTHKGRGIYVKTSDKDNDNAKKYKKDGDNYVAIDGDDVEKKKSDKVTDFSRDGEQPTDEPKDEPKDKEPYKLEISEEGMEAYEDAANNEEGNVKLDPPDFGEKKQREAVARRLFGKLQLLANGQDVEFTEADKNNLQFLTISSNTDSGQIFFGERTDTSAGVSIVPGIKKYKDSGAYQGRVNDKNSFYERWPKLKEKMEEQGLTPPKFKSPLGKMDNPPASAMTGHKNSNFKPNQIIKSRSKVSDLPPGVKNILTESGMKDEDEMLGGPIGDPNNPPPNSKDFVDSVKSVMDEILETSRSRADESSQKYIEKAHKRVMDILEDDSLSEDEKLAKLESELGKIQKEMYDEAGKLDPKEQASVLKDFAEVTVLLKYRCQKKEAYMPASGNFPIADVLVLERDGSGKVISINSVSVKSATKGTNIPGSSASEFCKHFANVYPEHKDKFDNIENLHRGEISRVKRENLDEETQADLAEIDKLDKVCDDGATWDELYAEAEKILSKVTDGPKAVEKIKKSMEKYMDSVGLEPAEPKVYAKALMEKVFRMYAQEKTKKTLNELDLELGVTYAEVRNVNGDLVVEEKEGEHKTSNMQIHDKGYQGVPDNESKDKCDDGTTHVSRAKYQKANTALKYKEPK